MAFQGGELEVGARVLLGDGVADLGGDIGEGFAVATVEGEVATVVQGLAEVEAAGHASGDHHLFDGHGVFLARAQVGQAQRMAKQSAMILFFIDIT